MLIDLSNELILSAKTAFDQNIKRLEGLASMHSDKDEFWKGKIEEAKKQKNEFTETLVTAERVQLIPRDDEISQFLHETAYKLQEIEGVDIDVPRLLEIAKRG